MKNLLNIRTKVQKLVLADLKKNLTAAIAEDPSGEFCNVCGCKNTFVDDCGWFYNEVPGKGYVPVCINCNTMPPGDR
ncbi:MAG: hypothetical protein E6R13_07200 [Spirochaetes bacterium]|nr:MAG: hypothetical protein E6R13_07200 [Spirochaetota bacterium]